MKVQIQIGDRVKGKTLHTGNTVVGVLEDFDSRENTVKIRTECGTHLCRHDSLELLQPKPELTGSPGGIKHLQMCPPELLKLILQPETVPF